jgi:hypothetical protein
LTLRGVGLAAATAVYLIVIPGRNPPSAQRNTVSVYGGQAGACFGVSDPGSVYTDLIMLSDNSCTNTRLGINIDSSDDTPNVIFSNNAVINPGISYSRVLLHPPK